MLELTQAQARNFFVLLNECNFFVVFKKKRYHRNPQIFPLKEHQDCCNTFRKLDQARFQPRNISLRHQNLQKIPPKLK